MEEAWGELRSILTIKPLRAEYPRSVNDRADYDFIAMNRVINDVVLVTHETHIAPMRGHAAQVRERCK
jgi:hypothetical protein